MVCSGTAMRYFATGLIFFVTTLTVCAQTARKVVFFTGEKDCGLSRLSNNSGAVARCSTIPTHRGDVSEIEQDGVALSLAFLDDRKYIVVAARISNSKSEPVMFDSDLWGAAHFKSQLAFYAGEKPIAAETSIPSRDLIRQMSSGTKLENSLDTFIAEGEKTSEVREVRRSDGTRIRTTVIVPDRSAQDEALRKSEIRTKNTANEQRSIRNNALIAKYVPANGFVKGLVYFRRVKKAEFILLSLDIGDSRFIFRFQLPKKKA